MKKRLGAILNFAVIFGTLVIVLVNGLNGENPGDSVKALTSMSGEWIALCFVGYLANLVCDAMAVGYFLRRQGNPVSPLYMMFVAVVGQFYSNITPGATGGQPMQVYYLHKRGVPTGLASSAMVVRFFSFQFMLAAIGTVMWISHSGYIAENLGDHIWFLILGYTYNAVMISLLVLITLRRGFVGKLINLCVRIGVKLRLIKKPEETIHKAQASVESFHDSIHILVSHPRDLVVQLIIGGLQLMSQMSILYFIYRGLHQQGAGFGQIVAVDIMEYFSAAWIPTPGASGAQELAFSRYFGSIFTQQVQLVAQLGWRFFTYYLSLIVGVAVVAFYGWRAGANPIKEREAAELAAKERETERETETVKSPENP